MIVITRINPETNEREYIEWPGASEEFSSTNLPLRGYSIYTGEWPLPVPPYIPTRAEIETMRQSRYTSEADPLYLEAQEDAARAGTAPDLTAWLAKKDQIRKELPYPL